MPKVFTSKSQQTGKLGEDIACCFLVKQGYALVDRNFSSTQGEIDIVARKDGVIYFVEVKSATTKLNKDISRETSSFLEVQPLGRNPAENVQKRKLSRILKTISFYKQSRGLSGVDKDCLVILVVYIDKINKLTRVEWLTP